MTAEDRSHDITQPLDRLHPNERLKYDSNYLRGTILEGLADPITGAVSEDDNQLLKFHGMYMQDDRDLRSERRHQKLEPDFQFMVRVRLPGGVCTTDRWLKLDRLAHQYASGTLRLTTRQTFQFHGIVKGNVKPVIQGINEMLLDTIAACGDDNRTVMASVNPHQSALAADAYQWAKRISDHLLPRSRAYHEIWLDEQRVAYSGDDVQEPIYGRTYLPRKFKIGLAVPPTNDIDVFSQDIGLIAIADNGALSGFNVCIGGGMGRTDNEPRTYPRLGDVVGFCTVEQVIDVVEKIVTVQRDYGNRVDRKRARMKYTVDDKGVDWFREEIERRLGRSFEAPRPYVFDHNGDRYGWVQGGDGRWHYTLFIENGRVKDDGEHRLMSGLAEIARVHDGEFRLTGNQNLIIANVADPDRGRIESLMQQYGLRDPSYYTPLRLHSMACVAFPTCGLAMAESERFLPGLITKLERIMAQAGIADQPINVRMTGCPNGCVRPYLGEIGFTGRGPGKYDVYLGAGFRGDRLNKPYLHNVDEQRILGELTALLHDYAAKRNANERFGDYVIRAGVVPEVRAGCEFNS